uniref:Uncharacterized protein n=1 Tax=Oryza brachyantha TaxID=4533 RepID=J3MLI0_ORYBR
MLGKVDTDKARALSNICLPEFSKEPVLTNNTRYINCFFLVFYLAQGFKIESTTIAAMTRSMMMAMNMHFLDFFCRLFASRSASLPPCR